MMAKMVKVKRILYPGEKSDDEANKEIIMKYEYKKPTEQVVKVDYRVCISKVSIVQVPKEQERSHRKGFNSHRKGC